MTKQEQLKQLGNNILVIGCAGAGKTTLCKLLHKQLKLPLIHLDRHYWLPNWQPPPAHSWQQQVKHLCLNKQWIMDGNYSNTIPIRMPYASCVIFLDMPRRLCLWRVIKRRFSFQYNRQRKDIPKHCQERINFKFYRWIWNYPKRSRKTNIALLHDFPGLTLHLRSPQAVANFLQSLNSTT